MKSMELNIAESEAEWYRYKIDSMGIRESSGRLNKAVKKRLAKEINDVTRRLQLVFKKSVFHPSYNENNENIIVSLTSTAARIKNIFPTLNSLLNQTHKPNLIILWLGDDCNYPGAVIKKIESMGIKIEYRKDLGPNTKYYYAFAEYKNSLVITVDDDILYHEKMIEELYNTSLKNPNLVVARRVHKMRFNSDKSPAKYRNWFWEYQSSSKPGYDLLATGVGGVLYPPAVMSLKYWQNTEFLKVCPACDDIWLKFCELSQKIKVCAVEESQFYKDVINKKNQKNALAIENINNEKNDERISACTQYFCMSKDLCERVLGEE